MKRIIALLLCLVLLAGCSASPAATATPTENLTPNGKYRVDAQRNEVIIDDAGTIEMNNDTNNRLFYHIFVGSFSDSNGDGIGDLRGIINRFDYLNDGNDNSGMSLGVEGIWLSPIFHSPSYHKYDVRDYYTIDPQFGTQEDLEDLIELCHERGVKLILDLVINHTSDRNQWFKDFNLAHANGDTESPYYDFYTWAESPAGNRRFNSLPGTKVSYECNFSGDMPELNFDSQAVRQRMVEVAKYWLDLGVDGFRFDAAKYIYLGEESRNAEFWKWYMSELRAIKPDIYSVAEVWDSDGFTYPYFASTNCFNFTMAQSGGRIAETAKAGDVNAFTKYVSQYMKAIQSRNPEAMPVTFIANHDTDRAAGFLTVASGQAFVGANLSILMPGSTFVYYGEEIGLKGSRGGANTDANRRLAMAWGDGDTVKNPVGSTYSGADSNGTVASQKPDEKSLYNHYKKLIAIRKANPEIASGTYTPLKFEGMKQGGFLSTLNGSTVAVLHNTSLSAVEIDLSSIPELTGMEIQAFAGLGGAALNGTTLTLDGQTSVVLK